MAQIKYVSRNQLHCTANLNFGFVNNLSFSVQLIFFLDHVLLLAKLPQKLKFFKIPVWRSDSMKRNFGRFIFKKMCRWNKPLPPSPLVECVICVSQVPQLLNCGVTSQFHFLWSGILYISFNCLKTEINQNHFSKYVMIEKKNLLKFGYSEKATKFAKNLPFKIWRYWVASDF